MKIVKIIFFLIRYEYGTISSSCEQQNPSWPNEISKDNMYAMYVNCSLVLTQANQSWKFKIKIPQPPKVLIGLSNGWTHLWTIG